LLQTQVGFAIISFQRLSEEDFQQLDLLVDFTHWCIVHDNESYCSSTNCTYVSCCFNRCKTNILIASNSSMMWNAAHIVCGMTMPYSFQKVREISWVPQNSSLLHRREGGKTCADVVAA
jgi:hypothetical protein